MSYNYNNEYDFYITKNYASMNASNTAKILVTNFSFSKNFSIDDITRKVLDSSYDRGRKIQLSQVSNVNWELSMYIKPINSNPVTSSEEFLWESLIGAAPTSFSNTSIFDCADGNVSTLPILSTIVATRNGNKVWVLTGVVESVSIELGIDNLILATWKLLGVNSQDLIEGAIPTGGNFTDRTNVLPNLIGKKTAVTLTKYTSGGNHVYTLPIIGGQINIKNEVQTYSTPKLGQVVTVTGHWVDTRIIEVELQCYLKGGVSTYSEFLVKDILTEWENGFEDGEAIITLNGYGTENIVFNFPLVKFDHANQSLDDIVTTTFKFTAEESTGNYSTITYNI